MGRVLTNNMSFAYSIESALGTAGTTWYLIEPNTINAFGATLTTAARSPIRSSRQRRKGVTTDLDSAVEFEADLTKSSFRDFIEGFVFATAVNSDVTDIASTAAETTGDTYTVAALTSAQADKMEVDTLLWVSGFSESGNNGLKSVDADIAASATAISVNENLVDEASPPSTARLSLAGHRIAAGDLPSWTWSSPNATLAETAIGTELAALGLTVGQMVHIGSASSHGGTVTNAFENASANDMYGYARVKTINTDSVVFDKVDAALQYTDASVATAVDVLFGEFVRNVDVDDSDYLEQSYHFEAAYENLDSPNDEYEYAKGNYCNSVTFNLPLTDKAPVNFGFIGTDTESPVTSGSRKSGASSATSPNDTVAFSTSSDIAKLRIQDTDETGLTTCFKSLSLTLNNNVSPEKCLGTLGATYMNTGNFEVDLEATLLFTEGLVVNRIRDNTTVTMDFLVKNEDGAIGVDIPSMTLGGGDKEFPVNESVLINISGEAYEDETLGTSIGISIFPFVP